MEIFHRRRPSRRWGRPHRQLLLSLHFWEVLVPDPEPNPVFSPTFLLWVRLDAWGRFPAPTPLSPPPWAGSHLCPRPPGPLPAPTPPGRRFRWQSHLLLQLLRLWAVPTPRLEAPAAPAPMASAAWRPTLPPSRECRYRPIRAGSGRCSQTSSPSAQTTRGMSGPSSFSATWGRHQLPCYKPMYFMWINFFSSPSGTRLPMRLPWTGFRGGSPGELLEAARSMAIPPWTFALMSGWTTSQ